jgi:hypothetical protein
MIDLYAVADAVADDPTCVCCHNRLWWEERQDGRVACQRCEADIAHWLREITSRWEQLPELRLKGTGVAGPRCALAGPGGSSAPGRLDVLNLLAGDAPRRLQAHEDTWRRQLEWTIAPWRGSPTQALAGVTKFLLGNLHWACHTAQADVDDLHRDAHRLVRELRTVTTGERTTRTPIGHPCPYPALGHPMDDPQAPACGGELRMDARTVVIRCSTCMTEIPRHRWLELGITLGTITLENAA